MREMNIREIQLVGLELMKDIHSFCVQNGIKYSLAYGTMLGAVRHEGFIPWDDDVDVMMPRPDYERFIRLYKSQKYYLKTTLERDCYTNFSRLYEVAQTRTIATAKPCKRETGVFIDIFPVDGVSDDPILRDSHYQKVIKIAKARLNLRFLFPRLNTGTFFSRTKTLIVIFKQMLINGGNMFLLLNKLQKLSSKYEFGTTNSCSYFCCNDAMKKNRQEIFKTEAFKTIILCQFETEQFYISSLYDEMLTTMYGDYMKLPPEEDRGPKHGFAKFYWIA